MTRSGEIFGGHNIGPISRAIGGVMAFGFFFGINATHDYKDPERVIASAPIGESTPIEVTNRAVTHGLGVAEGIAGLLAANGLVDMYSNRRRNEQEYMTESPDEPPDPLEPAS